jgi:hypothetical protein
MGPESRFLNKTNAANKAAQNTQLENINISLLSQGQALKGKKDEKENYDIIGFGIVYGCRDCEGGFCIERNNSRARTATSPIHRQ